MSPVDVDRPPLRVAVTALGCKVNHAEMADLAGVLAAAGCEVVPDHEPADVRVLNSCTVTLQADSTTRQRLRRLRRDDPRAHIVLTGCSVDGNPAVYLAGAGRGTSPPAGVDAVFANAEKERIADHVLQVARDRGAGGPPSAFRSRSRAFIKVQDGCNHRCTYCAVWRARGGSRSVPAADVARRVRAAVAAGHAELVLTGVDLGAYGRGQGTTLAVLTATLLDCVGNDARIRLSSVNSNDMSDELIALSAHPQLCSHWHMPLQSGSDAVLRAMHRGYRRAQYLRVCGQLRAADPDTEFTTDVMVGFPGETDADHAATIALLREVEMLEAHTFRYSPRPGTPAAALPGRAGDEVARRRSAEVRHAVALTGGARRRRAVGATHVVVWDRVADGTARGLTATYLEVEVPASAATRAGGRATVLAERLEGGVLRGRVTGS